MTTKKDDRLDVLRSRVLALPEEPGVYKWIDARGNILYIGKAKNIRKRMSSYVQDGVKRSAWTEMLVRQITDFDTTIVSSELEALILETNLIKNHRPKYNILMKDDKNYVYVRISNDLFPRIEIVRRMEDDGARYFGPKTSAETTRKTLSFLRSLFPFRTCKMGIEMKPSPLTPLPKGRGELLTTRSSLCAHQITDKLPTTNYQLPTHLPLDVTCIDRDRPTPCIDHHIKQCLGPCIGTVTPEEYKKQAIDGVVAFFEGKYQDIEQMLKEKMADAVKEKKFEKAATIRDQLKEMTLSKEKQIISDTSNEDADIIGTALLRNRASIVILRERGGKIIEEQNLILQGEADSIADVLTQWIPQYIESTADIPPLLIVGEEPDERAMLETWLQEKTSKRTKLHVPERGKKSRLLLLAEKNAEWKLKQTEAKWQAEERRTEGALAELQAILNLKAPPKRIEGYDISHLGGTATVGSMVVMVNGKPKKDHYRSFNITTVKHGDIDDYQSLSEVLKRRLRYITHSHKKIEEHWKNKGVTIGKARKKDEEIIRSISIAHPNDIGSDDIRYTDYIVARTEEEIIGFCRLFTYEKTIKTLRSLWVKEEWRGKKLGYVLIQKILQKIIKGKLYVHISKESLQEYYAEIGFLPVNTPPKPLEQKLIDWSNTHPDTPAGMILVYIASEHKIDESFLSLPDLLLIDGGKGQLSSIVKVLSEMQLNIPVIGLAKREEEIFLPDEEESIKLGNTSEARLLIQRLRDEAHRFANDRRERRLDAVMTHSKLDDIPEIGEETKQKLLKKFGGANAVLSASDDELLMILNTSQLKQLREKYPALTPNPSPQRERGR